MDQIGEQVWRLKVYTAYWFPIIVFSIFVYVFIIVYYQNKRRK